MINKFKKLVLLFTLFFLSENLKAQNDVTKFLGIPIDGTKTELIEKLKAKGFTVNAQNKEVLTGEFNGSTVNIHIKTNKNKVCRLMVAYTNTMSEKDIKINYNNLIQQFKNNTKYLVQPDSTLSKYKIPDEEDISYQLIIKNKQYEAIFYQKSENFDAIENNLAILNAKEKMNKDELSLFTDLLTKKMQETLASFNKMVWFTISMINGEYNLMIFYDNNYNIAKGEDL